MNKITSTLVLITFTSSSSFLSTKSLAATPGIDLLKKRTTTSFLKQANDPKSFLHRKLIELNQSDGRNPNGIFPKLLAAKDIEIVSIGGEDQFGSYCYGIENQPEHFKCSTSVTETYLVLIFSRMGVHKATDYQRLVFVVESKKTIEWKLDARETKYDYKELITIGEPTQIPIEKLSPNGSLNN